MEAMVSAYNSLLVPAVIALVLLFAMVKIVKGIVRLVLLLVLIGVLAGGYMAYQRITAVQTAAEAALRHNEGNLTSGPAVTQAVYRSITDAGLNPNNLQMHVVCAGPEPRLQVRYADNGFLFGVLNNQDVEVPLPGNVHC